MLEKPRPTDAELSILSVLWEHGPSTVRDVLNRMSRPIGYTTVLKLLQIMTEKRLVVRDETDRTHIYRAKHKQDQMQRRLVKDLIDRAFDGAADQLVLRALSGRNFSACELAEIRKLIDGMEGEHQ